MNLLSVTFISFCILFSYSQASAAKEPPLPRESQDVSKIGVVEFIVLFYFQDSLPTTSDLAEIVAKHLQPIHRQLADINERLEYIEKKLKRMA